ncbi:unnamed protein product, partial [Rotaria magnacalcarata]
PLAQNPGSTTGVDVVSINGGIVGDSDELIGKIVGGTNNGDDGMITLGVAMLTDGEACGI